MVGLQNMEGIATVAKMTCVLLDATTVDTLWDKVAFGAVSEMKNKVAQLQKRTFVSMEER